ncbi:DNA-binding transcriptional LysR family regulator [Rhizobium aquaticum]|uniref:DNA-binding transcriptional LysR family regulator n=1 Tax=Rhizobium aquaticum TaxID=1549636 RepID=A0ABV2J4E4_9HYPH
MRHNLRHLRVFLAVAEAGSVTRAAASAHLSQPAVTQAISKLEAALGVALFDRSPHGLFPTPAGETFRLRVQRAFALLDRVVAEIAPRLQLTITAAQTEALIAVSDAENFTLAAKRLGLAQPTVHRAITQLEQDAQRKLFERTALGTVATRLGHSLAQAARLALAELSQAEAELAELRSESAGKIVIGAMPLSRSHILPTAIVKFQQERQGQTILITEGPYAELLSGLRRGEIDFLIGALRYPVPIDDVEQRELFQDTAVMIGRPGHPIFGKGQADLAQLAQYPWVVSPPATPIRNHFDRLFGEQGLVPRQLVEAGSLILMREILNETDYLGFASGGQVRAEIARGLLRRIDFDLTATRRPIGLTTRSGWLPTPAQRLLIQTIENAA